MNPTERHPDQLKTLGLLIRVELLKRGWSEIKFGQETGIAQRTLNDRLNARSDWRLEELQAIADVLYDGHLDTLFATLDAFAPFATKPPTA